MNKFYKANNARGKANRSEEVWAVKKNDIIAACRIQSIAEHSLLVGLMVAENVRGQGIGRQLLREMLAHQSKPVYTFPYMPLIDWYSSLGFQEAVLDNMPKSVKEKLDLYQAQGRRITAMCYLPLLDKGVVN